MYKSVINPKYLYYSQWLCSIPHTFEEEGEIVQAKKNRNILKKIECKGLLINVKSFHVPRFFNRIVYTFFRKSKAERSYEHANILLGKGIGTPEPIALLNEYRTGLIGRSFYACIQLPADYQEVRCCYWGPLEGNEEMLKAFAQFTAKLHEACVFHTDYSPGNILWKRLDDGGYDFQLVDINRMKFYKVTMDKGCRNFARLFECDEIYAFVAKEYARARGWDESACLALMLKYQRAFLKKKSMKAKIKSIFK